MTPMYKEASPLFVSSPVSWVAFSAPDVVGIGDGLSVTITVTNPDTIARGFWVGGYIEATQNNVVKLGRVVDVPGADITLDPGESRNIVWEIPWVSLRPWNRPFADLGLFVSVACPDRLEWSKVWQKPVFFSPMAGTLSVVPTGNVRFNDLVTVDYSFTNPESVPLAGATIALEATRGFQFVGGTDQVEVPQPAIASGSNGGAIRLARAIRKGDAAISARVFSPTLTTSTLTEYRTIVGCLGDLDGGSSVDDADFSLFVQSYDILTVPPADPAADLNRDGVIDDTDFQLFVQAYNQLNCP